MPSEAEIYAVYQGYWFDYRPKQLDSKGARSIRQTAKDTAGIDLKIQRLRALLGTFEDKLILEVGAGTGEFLSAVRYAGAAVIANEISAEACDFLESALQIPVVRGELTAARWSFDSPDVIVMSDLIEHPVEPFTLLSQAVSLLKPGGRLVIWTPNGGGAGQDAAAAARWVGFRVDLEHLQYFSPRTIQTLAGTLGLHIDHLETTGYPGLSGIEDLPTKRHKASVRRLLASPRNLVKRLAPWIPQVKRMVGESLRPRVRGSYHLFAILTKP